MRRADREIKELNEIINVVKQCKVCRIAMIDGKRPYIVPVNFGFELKNDTIILYFHCAREGRKIDILKDNPYIAVEMDCGHRLIESEQPCGYGFGFQSVIGEGCITFLTDQEEKKAALQAIMIHQSGKQLAIPDTGIQATTVLRAELSEISGKMHM